MVAYGWFEIGGQQEGNLRLNLELKRIADGWFEIGGQEGRMRLSWNWFDAERFSTTIWATLYLSLIWILRTSLRLKILIWMLIIAGDKAICDNVDPRRSCRVDAARCI